MAVMTWDWAFATVGEAGWHIIQSPSVPTATLTITEEPGVAFMVTPAKWRHSFVSNIVDLTAGAIAVMAPLEHFKSLYLNRIFGIMQFSTTSEYQLLGILQ